jgi:hypothetical protein
VKFSGHVFERNRAGVSFHSNFVDGKNGLRMAFSFAYQDSWLQPRNPILLWEALENDDCLGG